MAFELERDNGVNWEGWGGGGGRGAVGHGGVGETCKPAHGRPAWGPILATHGLGNLKQVKPLRICVASSIKQVNKKPYLTFSLAFMKRMWVFLFIKQALQLVRV